MALGDIADSSERFKHIIKGYVKNKENLKRYITRDELIGKKGDKTIRIPVPYINIPRFRYGKNVGGVGQGDGEIGDLVGQDASGNSDGSKGGDGPDHGDVMDVEFSVNELEELVFEELGLPYLEPKPNQSIHAQKPRYNSIAEQGVSRNFKRTYKETLKRTIASGQYQPGDAVIPIRKDFRYRAATNQPDQQSNAVLFYMLDVSGSMDQEKRRLCRLTNSWLQRIIERYYKNVEERFIVHTTDAHEVEGPVFYGTTLDGGTMASSAFQKSMEIMQKDYPSEEWNIYCFYYSDGGNFEDDNQKALNILGNMLPNINLFGYGECNDGEELFMRELEKRFNLGISRGSDMPRKKIRTSTLLEDGNILETLRNFLNKDAVPFYQP